MAKLVLRLPQNAPGAFFVDDTCIDCDFCRSTSPAFFTRDDLAGTSYVYRQPLSAEEIEQAEECRSACPSESIGRDESLPMSTVASSVGEPSSMCQSLNDFEMAEST